MKSTATDHALAVIKAALNLAPGGGALASLIGDFVPSSRQRVLEKAADLLAERIDGIGSRIENETIDREDFADLFGKFQALAGKTNRELKLRAAANILANALLPPGDPSKSPFDELEHLMHCADALSSGAIAALGASIQIRAPRHASGGDASFNFDELKRKLPHLDPNLVLGLATELRSLNLLHITEGVITGRDYEGYLFQVTPLGSRFAKRFIEGEM
jgi:hypothetical protein